MILFLFHYLLWWHYLRNFRTFRCIEKPDPCNPSPCGPGTMCMANKFGNPICRCLGKLVPQPDTITGCGPECTVRMYIFYLLVSSKNEFVWRFKKIVLIMVKILFLNITKAQCTLELSLNWTNRKTLILYILVNM